MIISTVRLLLSERAGPGRHGKASWPGLACHRRPSNVPHLSSSKCRSAQAVAHFTGVISLSESGPCRAGTGRLAGLIWLACHRRPSNIPYLSQAYAGRLKRCLISWELGHYRRAAANQHTVEAPPWPTSTGRGSMLLSSSQPAALSNRKPHPLFLTTPNTDKHILVSQTWDGGRPGKLLHCRRQRRFQRIKIHTTLVLDGALE